MIRKKAWSSMDDFFNSEDYLDIRDYVNQKMQGGK